MDNEKINTIINNVLKETPIYTIKESSNEITIDGRDIYYKINNNTSFELYISKNQFADFFIRRLSLHFKREDFDIVVTERVLENCIIYDVELKNRNYIIVDDNFTLILLNDEKAKINKQREDATNLKQVKHFTNIINIIKILNTKCFYAKSLISYSSEKRFTLTKESGKKTFIVCFNANKINNHQMWNEFKNINKSSKACLEIHLKTSIANLFVTKPLKCFNTIDTEKNVLNKRINQLNGEYDEESYKGVYFDKMIRPVKYINKPCNNVNLEINGEDATIVDYVARSVKKEFSYQKEVRFIYYLRSCSKRKIDFFNKIELPFNFEQIEKFIVYVSKNIKDKHYQNLIKISQGYPIEVEIRKIAI